MEELENALREVQWDLIGLTEIRRNEEVTLERKNGYVLLHSSAERSMFGTGFIIKNKYRNNILNFIPVSKRIAILKVVFKKKRCTIFQVHAPTSEHKEEEIVQFYEDLDTLIEREHNESEDLIILGDFNACVGKKQSGDERIMGNYGRGKRNKSGAILVKFVVSQGLKISNSCSPHDSRWTWKSPNEKKYEIDYILTKQQNRIKNFKIEEDLQFETDHRMITITYNPSYEKYYQDKKEKGLKIRRSIESYKTHLKDLLQQINIEGNTIQETYNKIEESLKEAVKRENEETKEQGRKYSTKISENTKKLIQKREEMNKIPNKTVTQKIEHCEIRKLAKKKIREDIAKYEEDIINKIMDSTGSTKRIKKEISSVKTIWISKIKKEDGKITTNREEIVEEATRFYEKLYSPEEPNINEETGFTNIRMDRAEFNDNFSIMEAEVEKAIGEIKKEKAAGDDGITNELIIYGKESIIPKLTKIFNRILYECEIPKQWKISKIILIFKKGSREDISNYRPISLSSTIYKVFVKIIQQRLRKKIEEHQPPEQAGFRKSYSTMDNLQTINQLLEKSNEYQVKLSISVVDYVKAFDSIYQASIWEALKKIQVDNIYIQTLKELYKSKAYVALDRTGREFDIRRGTKQGCPLSAELFNTVLELIFSNINWEGKGVIINGENLTNMMFADDVILIGKDLDELRTMMIELREESKKHGLDINMAKTNILTKEEITGIEINGVEIKRTQETIYLGQLISHENVTNKEVERRIKIGWNKYWAMKKIFKSMKVKRGTKAKALKMCIFSAILYGCQTWALTKKLYNKLDVTQYQMMRSILNIKRMDKISNRRIGEMMKMEDLSKEAKVLKWRWAGHVTRMQNSRWAKKTTEWIPRANKRKRGRQKTRWYDEFKKHVGATWQTLGRNREKWEEVVKTL
ncbi:hypothetical protein M8J76_002173 [Diaphorina citri]|nr:hypothetical protein M8J76_002173 [Diaphorina citri]